MSKNATISLRIDEEIKKDAEAILKKLGISTSEAIKIFFSAIRNKKGLPFPLQLDDTPFSSVSATRSALLSIRGKYDKLPSSEDFCMRKQLEIDHEEKRLKS